MEIIRIDAPGRPGRIDTVTRKAIERRTTGILRTLAGRSALTAGLWLAAGLVGAALALWSFAELTELRRFDRAALLWVDLTFPETLNATMRAVTALGYYQVVLPLLAASSLLFYVDGRRLSAALLCASTGGGVLLTTVLKAVFRRERPELIDAGYTASFYSFPSAHATVAVGFYGALAVILTCRLRGLRRWAIAAGGASLVVLIGFSRLYLGVHYPTDVLAGFLTAGLWVAFVAAAYAAWLSIRDLGSAEPRRRSG